jgi:hypothetical protein
MTGITMYDTALNNQFPAGAAAYAAYVDGSVGTQPNYAYIVSAFPKAQHLSIALFARDNADALDVESGAAAPSDVPGWYARQVARGVQRPVIYASVSAMSASILPALSKAGIARAQTRLWTAHYGLGEHICGPGTCRALSVNADGTQWTSNAKGLVLDQSLLVDNFFAPPADWAFSAVRYLTAKPGRTSVELTFSSPGVPAPLGVGHYQVTIRKGAADVPSYPRTIPKGSNPQVWQGGSLTPNTPYTALVRAIATDGGHGGTWATVTFTTT